MKITRRKITAASSPKSAKIPAPFDKYYRLMSDKEFEDYTGGYPAHPSPCEEAQGYNIKHYSYAVAKPEYEDELGNNGLDIVELVTSDWDKNKIMLAYVVNDRIYPVDESEMPEEDIFDDEDIEASSDLDDVEYDDIYDEEDLYDRDAVMQAIKDEFGIDDYDAYTIYDWYDAESAQEDFYSIADFVDYIRDDIYDMLDACDDEIQKQRIIEAIEGCSNITANKKVNAAVDTGLQYWYLTKHGLGPGMIPEGVSVIDAIDDGWDTYVLLDKMLTTQELKYYDLKEKFPPEELLACNRIEGATVEELQKKFAQYKDKQDKLGNQLDDLQENAKKKSGLFRRDKKKTEASECHKVSEDDESIHYVVASDDEEDEDRPDWIVDYPIPDDPDYIAKEEHKRIARELADEEDYYDRLHGEGEYEGDPHDVYGAEEVDKEEEVVEEEEDFLDQPEQEFKSDKTAVNGKQGKLPAVFKKANIPNGALVLDYGGGTPESEAVAQAFLDQFEAKEMLYDPFNQTPEHNRQVVRDLKANGGADVAVCSNVLNVIKEQEVRLDLLNKIKKLLKSGATAYISVYEGPDKDRGVGKVTQKGQSFQNNMELGSYLEEVQSVFPDATKRGTVIVAPNTNSVKKVESSTDIHSIDLAQLEADIKAGCEEYLTSPEGGFSPSGTPKESQWDMNADEIYIVEVNPELDENRIQVEVRAELGYEGMIRMSEILDKIIEQYDPDAYFDMVTSGIMDAYIYDNSVYGSTRVDEYPYYDMSWEESFVEPYYPSLYDPEYNAEPEEEPEYDKRVIVDDVIDFTVNVEENGDWMESREDPSNLGEIETNSEFVSVDDIIYDSTDLIDWNIPSEPGKYHIKGNIHMEYLLSGENYGEPIYKVDMQNCKLSDVEITPAGKVDNDSEDSEATSEDDVTTPKDVESSTKVVEAGMTNEDVEDAILNGKPFELDAFRRYWGEDHSGEVKAEQIEVGDVFKVNTAEIVDFGTVVKVIGINEPEVQDDFFDYTFRCEILEPGNDKSGTSGNRVGEEQMLYYDADEYVGQLIPV